MDILALDFDGVLCDSAFETGTSGWRAGREIWPEWQDLEPPPTALERFRVLRPLLETGYEAILLMRLAWQGAEWQEVAPCFHDLCRELIEQTGRSRDELIALFGRTRDLWIARDLDGWLARHRTFPGILEKLAPHIAADTVYILTTKQERFVQAWLGSCGVHICADRLFGLESAQPKTDTLASLLREHAGEGVRLHFVEDRLQTLLQVVADQRLEAVNLYFAAWGYNTHNERDEAARHPRITVWERDEFLRTGLTTDSRSGAG